MSKTNVGSQYCDHKTNVYLFAYLLIIYLKETMGLMHYTKQICTPRQKEICNLISIGLWSGIKDSWYNNLLGVSQAYKAGFGCITFPWCPFHCGITWPVTPELAASTAWDEIAHWTEGVCRSLAFSIHSPGWKHPPRASEAEWETESQPVTQGIRHREGKGRQFQQL